MSNHMSYGPKILTPRVFDLKVGDLIQYQEKSLRHDDFTATRATSAKTMKITKIYPFIFECIGTNGKTKTFSKNDYFCGIVRRLEE